MLVAVYSDVVVAENVRDETRSWAKLPQMSFLNKHGWISFLCGFYCSMVLQSTTGESPTLFVLARPEN